jgi:O-antigen/teichoic acid export membrane protein
MDFVSSIFPLIGGVLISIFKKNLVWLSGWNLFIQVVILFIYLAVTVRRINWNWSPKIPTVKRIFNFSIFMFIESSAITLFQQFDRVLVGMILGPVIAGVYSVATSVGLRMSLITGQITEVMIPYASQKETSGDYQSLLSVYRKLNRYLGIMVVFISTIGIIWMKELLTLWIGKNYADQYSLVFSLIILAYAFLSLTRSGHQTLTGMGKVKFTAINYLCATFVMLLGLIILTRIYGLIGAATANILMVGLFIMNIYAYKLIVNDSAIKSFLEDSLFGLLIPTFSIFIIVFGLPLSIRVLYSLLVIILLFILIMTDKELVGSLKNIQINSFIK